jgi:GAF domain-containing protein
VPTIDPETLSASLRRLSGVQDEALEQALEHAVSACVDLFRVTGSGLMVADDQNTLRYVAASDGPGKQLELIQTETGQGPCVDTFVHDTVVTTEDLAADRRWPVDHGAFAGLGVRAMMGVPVRLGGIVVGSLDVYRDSPGTWDATEVAALQRYSDVIEATMHAALRAHSAGELADQLQYALDYRVVIERAVGYLMGRDGVDAVAAFDVLRRAARNQRRRIADVAQQLLDTGTTTGPPAGATRRPPGR